MLFVDDSTLTCKFINTSSNEILNLLTTALKDVLNWIKANKPKVKTSKCKFISFSHCKKLSLPPNSIDYGYINETYDIKIADVLTAGICLLILINTICSKLSSFVVKLNKMKVFFFHPRL